jgi:hypothetical protein
LLAAP